MGDPTPQSTMRILVVDDEENMREACRKGLERVGYEVEAAADAQQGLERLDAASFDLALLDIRMPGMSGVELLEAVKERDPDVAVVMMTGFASVENAVECMKKGAADYVAKPFTPAEVREVVQRVLAGRDAAPVSAALAEPLQGPFTRSVVFGTSRSMRRVHRLMGKVAGQTSNVLITGESGTGKELLARLIHEHSPRATEPFVVVNCAAIPESLLESELFGHRKGAFTSADYDREGSFQTASSGTLFMDEIGEMPGPMQAAILRAIEHGEIKQVGSDQAIRVDVRIIAATNRDIAARVETGEFRRDLYYRLNVVHMELPPLRGRKADIPVLAQHFVERLALDMGKPPLALSPEALDALAAYPWPGNVRELENAIERAVMMAEGEAVRVRDLPQAVADSPPGAAGQEPSGVNWDAIATDATHPTLADVEMAYMQEVLRRCQGNRSKAAKWLGITPVTIWRKLGGGKGGKAG